MEKNEYAISTAWNYDKNIEKIFEELIEIGFSNFEISFHFRKEQISLILQAKKKLQFKVISLHNFCPFPLNNFNGFPSPDIFSLSAQDKKERELAIKYTIQTIKTAEYLEAKYVILHAGRVAIEDKTNLLAKLKKENESLFLKERDEYLNLRNEIAKENLEAIKFSLDEIIKYIQNSPIKLCLETRYYLSEFPDLPEFEIILNEFSHPQICYWHDCGHAGVRQYLGIYSQKDYLNRLKRFLAGFHFHDIYEINDHLPIGKGQTDFTIFQPYHDRAKVIEIHQPATKKEILESKIYLEQILNNLNQ